jgi:HNH endonuclease
MSAPTELKLLRSIKTGKGLIKLIKSLKKILKLNKLKGLKHSSLNKLSRNRILAKTDSHCHICGLELDRDNFQADHVKSHIGGGGDSENNYLPSCSTCNNYRWHYSSEEIQIILKLGVWARSKIASDTPFGLEIANQFVKHQMGVRKRRKTKQV